jgi:hypothetical protein
MVIVPAGEDLQEAQPMP